MGYVPNRPCRNRRDVMFQALKPQPEDKILALMQKYKEDPRDTKIDLGVGVYKDANGQTPIMRAVKAAEKTLWEQEQTKSYVALAGDPAFSDAMVELVLGDAVDRSAVSAVATPGGTGAVRQGFDLVKMANPNAKIYVSDPTWPNHLSILKHMDMPFTLYRYFDNETRGVDFDGMMADLAQAQAGDIVLLHGCCHNPTGANLNMVQWGEIIARNNHRGQLFEKLWHLSRTDGYFDGCLSGYICQGPEPKHVELFESPKLFIPTRSRCASGYHGSK